VDLFANLNGNKYRVYGYGLKPGEHKLADRLIAAWKAKAFSNELELLPTTDSSGSLYVQSQSNDHVPLGRTMNASLKKLGF
jgi:hypothetical protein